MEQNIPSYITEAFEKTTGSNAVTTNNFGLTPDEFNTIRNRTLEAVFQLETQCPTREERDTLFDTLNRDRSELSTYVRTLTAVTNNSIWTNRQSVHQQPKEDNAEPAQAPIGIALEQ